MMARLEAGDVLVLGHRGARAYAPMNTLPSFMLAIEQGADGVELDVWRTKDGALVVIHDDTVDATTNGSGSVHDMTLSQLKALDAGGYFDSRFAGTTIPTLDEVFGALPTSAIINIEIKKIDNTSTATDGVESLVVDCILRHNAQERVIVSSFNPHALQHVRAASPVWIPLGYLYLTGNPQELLGPGYDYVTYLHPYHELLSQESVAEARALRRWVNSWTVNDADAMTRLLDLGVTGLITDMPDVALQAVAGWKTGRVTG